MSEEKNLEYYSLRAYKLRDSLQAATNLSNKYPEYQYPEKAQIADYFVGKALTEFADHMKEFEQFLNNKEESNV